MALRRTALIAVPLLLVAVLAYVYRAQDPLMRGLLRFAAWRTFSPNAGASHYADVNDVRLFYQDHGAGPPVLVLHGGLGFLEMMGGQISALAHHHRVIAVDSRGHGRSSSGPEPLRYETMAADMTALLDRLGIDHYDVVGWSDGGNIGLDLAMTQPERVDRVVAIGANARADGLVDDLRADLEQGPSDAGPPGEIRTLERFLMPDPRHFAVQAAEVREMWMTEPQWSDADLGRIQARTLLLVGEHDAVKPEHTRAMAAAIPNARVETFKGATHGLPIEHPRRVARRIIEFLDAP
jgi:pimeloyl-ACP methyl ester carboxylesterase